MQTNKFDLSVTDIDLGSRSVEKAQIGCYVTLNNQDLDCIIVDDTDHRLVLDLSAKDELVRITAKGLSDNVKIGSVSIQATTFITFAENTTKEIWITLFDDESDDLYDGNFSEDDPEIPRIKVSFTRGTKPTKRKKAKTTKTTNVTTTRTVVETTRTVSEQEVKKYNVETLKSELRSRLEDLIETLRTDQDDIEVENKERVAVLANLETVHAELKGEDDQDKVFTKALEDLQNQIADSLNSHRKDIEARKQELLDIIKRLDDETKKSQKDKADAEKEKARLTKIVETPEDLKENGFTKESKDLRNNNNGLRSSADKMTKDLLDSRDKRNDLISAHGKLVDEFENTVLSFHDNLRKAAQTKKSFAFEKAGLQKELEFNDLESDYLRRKQEGNDIDAQSLKEALDRLNVEYKDTDDETTRYTDLLRLNLKNQEFILSGLAKRLDNVKNKISDGEHTDKLNGNKLDHIREEITKLEQIGYDDQYAELSKKLQEGDKDRRESQDQLEKAHGELVTKLELFANDLQGIQRERDEQANKVGDALKNLQGVTDQINALLKEIEALENKQFTDNNRDEVSDRLAAEKEAIQNKLKFAQDEHKKIRGELDEALRTLDEKHRLIEDQKRRIQELKNQIEQLRKNIDELNKIIAQLEKEIQEADEELERLRNDDEIERLQARADELEARIRELESILGDVPPEPVTYKAQKGDLVDEMLAKYIQNCPVPVKRLGGGFYLFGTRKIYAKIMNGKLVIRVGGGYMVIEEFIETYAEQELSKINNILQREGLESVDQIDLEEYCLKGNKTAYGNTVGEASPSSKGSFNASGSFKRSLNGTGRSPKGVKASQIVSQKK